ncbi:MAG: SAM-dependent methyltransferase, partial [Candidatus Phytoplasma australasiaticum]|nr:SAM-dependent methyltransferase [Candidatus Phytoplasma australasiaticum]
MKRILFIASLIKNYNTVADIGTDHGLVLKKALDLGYICNAFRQHKTEVEIQLEKNIRMI